MDPITTQAAAAGATKLLEAAAVAFKPGGAADVAKNVSLTQYLSKTILVSRVYIDGAIAHDDVIPNIVRAGQTIYVSLILNALQLDRLVTKTASVKELLRTVSTEALCTEHVDLADKFALHCGLESAVNVANENAASEDQSDDETPTMDDRTKRILNGKAVEADKSGMIPMGRQIEVELANPDHPKDPGVKISLLIQMIPYLINAEITPEFIKLNARAGFLKRWLMWKAGEISFWKDFVFATDIFRNKRAVLKNDPDGVLADYLRDQAKKDRNVLGQIYDALAAGGQTKDPNRNIANTVLIMSEDQVKRAKVDSGFDLHDSADRKRFFQQTYAMLIYVVDPMYNTVKMYMNGIAAVGEYTFDMFKPKGKSNDVVDLLSAVNAMSQGKAPRF